MDVDDRGAEEVLGVDFGNRCCETSLDGWKTAKVREIAGVVGKRVGTEDLSRDRSTYRKVFLSDESESQGSIKRLRC